MLEAIQGRELIVLDGLGFRLQGTYHRPAELLLPNLPGSDRRCIGVLFVNSLSLPRAASGDSAVHWADSTAELGYPSFRIDLPGLGDSQGEASSDLMDRVNAGGFAAVTDAAARQLVERFGLSGMVIFGHCAGAVSALYTGAVSTECKGLILLDPYFHLPNAKRPEVRERLSDWARQSKIGRFMSNNYDRSRKLFLLLRGNTPPGNANLQLLGCWKQVASASLPILVLKAPGIKANASKPRVGEFDYVAHVMKLAGRKGRVSVDFLECADHSFANREGRQAVQQQIQDWLVTHFPLADLNLSASSNSPLHSGENKSDSRKTQDAPANKCGSIEGGKTEYGYQIGNHRAIQTSR